MHKGNGILVLLQCNGVPGPEGFHMSSDPQLCHDDVSCTDFLQGPYGCSLTSNWYSTATSQKPGLYAKNVV